MSERKCQNLRHNINATLNSCYLFGIHNYNCIFDSSIAYNNNVAACKKSCNPLQSVDHAGKVMKIRKRICTRYLVCGRWHRIARGRVGKGLQCWGCKAQGKGETPVPEGLGKTTRNRQSVRFMRQQETFSPFECSQVVVTATASVSTASRLVGHCHHASSRSYSTSRDSWKSKARARELPGCCAVSQRH